MEFGVGNGAVPGVDEDPAAAFLAQHQDQIEGIEGEEGLEEPLHSLGTGELNEEVAAVNGEPSQENDADAYAAISQVDQQNQEPDIIRKWREEQIKHLEELDANSCKAEIEWREKAKKELEDWYTQQEEQIEETKTNNRIVDEAFYKQPFSDVIGYVTNIKQHCYNLQQTPEEAVEEVGSGSDWERVLLLCDMNSKSSKQSKDVSRMRSVIISLNQMPLATK
ncbi:clathrin light chain A isoform X1 [Callorhinchus milii]|uniref:clathrin light chain A isoform X1 n=1 Tax=Callorhinchus milii TaxID=7868 RepID=UPI001C3FAA97|nr:clathrin light chain A isoform X1 [Callorhinchus milii]